MDTNIFGKRLKLLRNEKHLTGEEFGKIFNVTKVAVSNWESGRRFPEQTILTKIADYFNVTTDYLLGRTNERTFTVRDEKSICNDLKQIMDDFKSGQAGPAFYGDTELDEEELALIEDAFELALIRAKKKNKQKYTPKKYKNKSDAIIAQISNAAPKQNNDDNNDNNQIEMRS